MSGATATAWETVVGLEIHVQLKTRTKMFCRCAAGFGGGENTQTCPVCLGFPGALPVINRTAIEWTVKLGLALGCEIAPRAVFARKNYFYPDLPKGYQISQYDLPSCDFWQDDSTPAGRGARRSGSCAPTSRRTRRRRCTWVAQSGRIGGAEYSLVDYNRGGTPLARDRDGAGHPLGRGGEALPAAAAADDRRARDLRRRDGEGHVARRRQRVRAPVGVDRAANAVRDQEHELVQLHRPGHRCRGRAPDRRLGGGRRGAAGDVRLRRRHAARSRRAARRRRRTTTATSRSRISCRSSRRRR